MRIGAGVGTGVLTGAGVVAVAVLPVEVVAVLPVADEVPGTGVPIGRAVLWGGTVVTTGGAVITTGVGLAFAPATAAFAVSGMEFLFPPQAHKVRASDARIIMQMIFFKTDRLFS